MKKISRFITFMFLIFLLQGCNNREKVTWNIGNTCKLPCWNGAVVGSTTKSELMQVLKELPVIDQEKTLMDGESWQFFSGTSYFAYKSLEIHGVVYYLGEKLVCLTFDGDLGTTFGDMVELVGTPEFVISIPLLQPTTHNSVIAIYPSTGIAFAYSNRTLSKRLRNEISPDIPIDYISIFDPEIYDEMVNSSLFGQGILSGEETMENLRPWVGYGSLNELYPPAKEKIIKERPH